MSPAEQSAVRRAGQEVGQIAALCELIGEALAVHPETSTASDAVDGVAHIARRLSDSLIGLADLC